MKNSHMPFATLLGAEILTLLMYGLSLVSLGNMYTFAIAFLATALILSHRGIFPFGADRKIANRAGWIAIAIIPIISISSLANSDIMLFWYPTNHRIWALFPLVIFGAISVRYRLVI